MSERSSGFLPGQTVEIDTLCELVKSNLRSLIGLFWLHLIGGIGMGSAMGLAGIDGMLRRSIYVDGEYNTYMVIAGVFGAMLILAFVLFLFNVVMTFGVKGLLGIYSPAKLDTSECVPAQQEA